MDPDPYRGSRYYTSLLENEWIHHSLPAEVGRRFVLAGPAVGDEWMYRSQADLFLTYNDALKAIVQEFATQDETYFKTVFQQASQPVPHCSQQGAQRSL